MAIYTDTTAAETTDQHVLPGMQAEVATTFEQPGNPKVIGETKALVEGVEETVETREKNTSERQKPRPVCR
jgi:hypothetical protein